MKPKYPAMFCTPKPVITNTYYLYQRQYAKSLQHVQPRFSDKKRRQRPQQIDEKSITGGPSNSMGGLALALDPVSNRYTETTTTSIAPIVHKKGVLRKAKSELLLSSKNKKLHNTCTKNPAAMLHSNYNNNNNNTCSYGTSFDNVSCIHGHYNINYPKPNNNYQRRYRPKLIKSSKLDLLIPDLLQYRVIQCGYITKQGKIRRNWKERFALLLCAKINDNYDEKRDEKRNDYYFQFKLLYFEDDTLSNLKGCVSFNTLGNINIGLIAPKSACKTTKLAQTQHLSTPIRPRHDNEERSLSLSMSVSMARDIYSDDAHFYKLLNQNPTAHNLQNVWSSFPNYNGFYIIDQQKDRVWFMDTKTFKNAKKWLLAIWEIDKYFGIKKKSKKSKKKSKRKLKNVFNYNLNEINEVNEIKDIDDMKKNELVYDPKELCLKNGFSDFVSIEMEGYVSENIKKNQRKKYETLKYMIIIPNQCQIRFKGILLFDIIDNKYKNNANNKNIKNNYSQRKRFKPNFNEKPAKIRMKQKSMFVDKLIKERDRGSNSYFEIIGDLTKCLCNARNDTTKTLWNVAFNYYKGFMSQ